ncbi:hypothetical protein [Streptomyces sp. NPDC059262]
MAPRRADTTPTLTEHKNSARVMLVRAGWNPDGVEGARPPGPLDQEAA